MKTNGFDFLSTFDPGTHESLLEIQPLCGDLVDSLADRLYGDLYQRNKLTLRERLLVTIAGLIEQGNTHAQLKTQLRLALKNGISREELMELANQMSAFSGYAKAMNAAMLIDMASLQRSDSK